MITKKNDSISVWEIIVTPQKVSAWKEKNTRQTIITTVEMTTFPTAGQMTRHYSTEKSQNSTRKSVENKRDNLSRTNRRTTWKISLNHPLPRSSVSFCTFPPSSQSRPVHPPVRDAFFFSPVKHETKQHELETAVHFIWTKTANLLIDFRRLGPLSFLLPWQAERSVLSARWPEFASAPSLEVFSWTGPLSVSFGQFLDENLSIFSPPDRAAGDAAPGDFWFLFSMVSLACDTHRIMEGSRKKCKTEKKTEKNQWKKNNPWKKQTIDDRISGMVPCYFPFASASSAVPLDFPRRIPRLVAGKPNEVKILAGKNRRAKWI